MNSQRVGPGLNSYPQFGQFSRNRGDAVGLLDAQIGDISYGDRLRGERGKCTEGLNHVRHGVHIDIDAGEPFRAADLDTVRPDAHGATHTFQDVHETNVTLRGIRRKVSDLDPTACKRRCCEKIRGVGCVRFNGVFGRRVALP